MVLEDREVDRRSAEGERFVITNLIKKSTQSWTVVVRDEKIGLILFTKYVKVSSNTTVTVMKGWVHKMRDNLLLASNGVAEGLQSNIPKVFTSSAYSL